MNEDGVWSKPGGSEKPGRREASNDSSRSVVHRHPLRYLLRHGRWVLAGVICLLGTNVMAQLIPWVVKQAIEAMSRAGSPWEIGRLALIIAGLAAGQAAVRIPSRIFIFYAAREAEYGLRDVLFHRLVQASPSFYRSYRVGDIMTRLTSDLSSVRALYGPAVLHLANTAFAYGVALPLMTRIDPWLTLWALLPYPLLLLGTRMFALGIYSRSKEMQEAFANMTSVVQEDLAGIREVKLYQAEDLRSSSFSRSSRTYQDQAIRLARWRAGMIPFIGLGAGISLIIVLWSGGIKVIAGELSLADLVAINLYVAMLAWPTMSIGWILSLWQRGLASWHRLQDITTSTSPLEVNLEADPGAAPRTASPRTGQAVDLELHGLSMGYGDKPVLRDVSFTVPGGAICGLVGRVGSGKTTLMDALARLIEVPDGTVLIGGRDVNDLPVDGVRDLIAYAPQNAFLFSRSIRDNIALGFRRSDVLSDEDRERRIEDAIRIAGLTPDMDSFPGGLGTVIGERGHSLSGGQRQRIALARALVSRRPILLLDDSLSSVDAETEKQILEELEAVMSERTVVLVSHRLSALRHADQIVVIDDGEVREVGGHAALLDRGGIYAELYRGQLRSGDDAR